MIATIPPRHAGAPAQTLQERPLEPAAVDSQTLLAGRRELVIQHGAERYRLTLTAQNKLILTK